MEQPKINPQFTKKNSRNLPSINFKLLDVTHNNNFKKPSTRRNPLSDKNEALQVFNTASITMDIDLKKFELEQSIKSIESKIAEKEKARNMKMQTDFEKERNYLIDQQKAIKLQIEATSSGKNNEKYITAIKAEINSQQELFNRVYNLNSDLLAKINKLKQYQKETSEKIERKRKALKAMFLDNIGLMEKIKNMKNLDKSLEIIKETGQFLTEQHANEESPDRISNNKHPLFNSIENIVNISTVIEENHHLRDKYNYVQKLKSNSALLKSELDKTILKCGSHNKDNIILNRIFTEGVNELSKEILKIHEVQKASFPAKTLSRNNLYNGLIKGKTQHFRSLSENYHLEGLSQAKSINNMKEKYKNSFVSENVDPHNIIYNVITNLFKENKHLYEKYQVKRKKLEWSEFEELNSYQIYALLFLNEGSIKKMESKLFPKVLKTQSNPALFLTGMTEN